MRLFFTETFKALGKKSIICIIILLTILNGVLLWINENKKNADYSPSSYKAIYSYLDNKSVDEAYSEILLKSQKLQLIDMLSLGEDISEELKENKNINGEELLKEYNNSGYLQYTKNIFSEESLVNDVLSEIESSKNYSLYLDNIAKTANKMTSISIFADPNSFSYKNIIKTPQDFKSLNNSELKIGASRGIKMATDFLPTDLLGFMIILIICMQLITREKELNQNIITRTTFNGRNKLGVSKLFVCFLTAIISVILLYSVNFFIAYRIYGFGNLTRPIQSAIDFNTSNIKLSVLEYFKYFILAKIGVYILFATLIYFVTTLFNSALKVYGIIAITTVIESVLYYTIPNSSYLCLFKYINLIAYANTFDLFSAYLNLNIFGTPINYVPIFVFSVVIFIFVFGILSIKSFSKTRAIKNKKLHFKFNIFNIHTGRNTNLFFQECYKIFIGGKVLFILMAFAMITAFAYEPMRENFNDADEIYYKNYMQTLAGEYNSDKQKIIDDEDKKLESARENMQKEIINSNDENIFATMKYQKILAPENAFEQVKIHTEYLKKTNGEFVYDTGYKLLTGDKLAENKDLTLALTAMIMAILCLTYIYSVEYQTGANVLLKTSAKGRMATFISKFFIGLIIITIVYFLTYAPYFYNVLHTYGTAQINAPILSIETFENWHMSIKNYLILISLMRYSSLIFAMIIIYFLSSKIKSLIGTMITTTGIFILPILLSLLGVKIFDYILLNPLIIGNIFN